MKKERYSVRRALWWFWINVVGVSLHVIAIVEGRSPFYWLGLLFCTGMAVALWRKIADQA